MNRLLIFWADLQFDGEVCARAMLVTIIVLHTFNHVIVVRKLDNLSLWTTRFLLTSCGVAVGLQLLEFYSPL
jgi:hypothetical protein